MHVSRLHQSAPGVRTGAATFGERRNRCREPHPANDRGPRARASDIADYTGCGAWMTRWASSVLGLYAIGLHVQRDVVRLEEDHGSLPLLDHTNDNRAIRPAVPKLSTSTVAPYSMQPASACCRDVRLESSRTAARWPGFVVILLMLVSLERTVEPCAPIRRPRIKLTPPENILMKLLFAGVATDRTWPRTAGLHRPAAGPPVHAECRLPIPGRDPVPDAAGSRQRRFGRFGLDAT